MCLVVHECFCFSSRRIHSYGFGFPVSRACWLQNFSDSAFSSGFKYGSFGSFGESGPPKAVMIKGFPVSLCGRAIIVIVLVVVASPCIMRDLCALSPRLSANVASSFTGGYPVDGPISEFGMGSILSGSVIVTGPVAAITSFCRVIQSNIFGVIPCTS